MTCNVGGVDRVVRVLVGIILIPVALFIVPGTMTKASMLVIAAGSLATAWYGFCFINKMLGINTAKPATVRIGNNKLKKV